MYFRLIFKELNESRKLPKSKYTINDLLDYLELSSETIVAKKNDEIVIEETEINELSYEFLEVYDKMNIYNPKVQIKVAESTPKDFLLKALDMIRRGNNSLVFVFSLEVNCATFMPSSKPSFLVTMSICRIDSSSLSSFP